MSEYLGPLLTEPDEIIPAIRKRKKTYIEKSITSKTKKNLEEKAKLEEKDGWRILRKNKSSFRLSKDKPLAEQMEDNLWTIVASMGFNELSDGRNFTISAGTGLNPRQIDVFAKDDESALFIECTSCEEPKKKMMGHLIEKIVSIRSNLFDSVYAHYGKSSKLKLRWIIATRNIEWGKADLEKAKSENIILLREDEIAYYERLTQLYKKAAKYQLLSHIFSGESIKGLDFAVPATRGKMGGSTFYNFLIKPNDLLKISYISHKASRDINDLETYQRMLVPKRLKEIGEYIDNGGQFPTNIVINVKGGIRFEKREKIGDSAFGTLYLPDKYASAWVIDGQHRLYGFTQSDRSSDPYDKTTVPVLAYENLSSTKEAQLFIDINCQQVRVTKSLLKELYATLQWDSDSFDERIDALSSRVVMGLDQSISPFQNRIIVTNRGKTSYRCLTLTSFSDGLRENRFFGEERKSGILPGLLTDSNSKKLEDTMYKGIEILSSYFSIFAGAKQDQWALGDAKGGYLCTNNAIRSLLKVLREILLYINQKYSIDIDLCRPDDLKPLIKKYINPLIEHFTTARADEFETYRSRQALKGVRQNAMMMMVFINTTFNDFLPTGLKEFLETVDEEGTKEAENLINEIEDKLLQTTISELKLKFNDNENAWWFNGIPDKIREECGRCVERDKGKKEKHQYVYLIDLHKIAYKNWDVLQKYYSFTKDGGKEKQLKWLVELNDIRNVTHHRPKWPATKDQVSKVREIHVQLMENLKNGMFNP